MDWRTADIILAPPGDPVVKKNSLFLNAIVGDIELSGLFPGIISLAFAPRRPN